MAKRTKDDHIQASTLSECVDAAKSAQEAIRKYYKGDGTLEGGQLGRVWGELCYITGVHTGAPWDKEIVS